jgi:hypothetical protein
MQHQLIPDPIFDLLGLGLILGLVIVLVWFCLYYVRAVSEVNALTHRGVALAEETVSLLREISAKLDRDRLA